MVGHLLEYHPAILKLRELVDAGELGDIHHVYSNRLNLGKVRREENILWSFAPHDISVILRLLGRMPTTAYHRRPALPAAPIADVTMTCLNFPGRTRAHIFVSWLHPYKEQRLVVVGSRRMAVFDDVADRASSSCIDQGIEWQPGAAPVIRRTAEAIPLLPAVGAAAGGAAALPRLRAHAAHAPHGRRATACACCGCWTPASARWRGGRAAGEAV